MTFSATHPPDRLALLGLVDHAHAPFADAFEDSVMADLLWVAVWAARRGRELRRGGRRGVVGDGGGVDSLGFGSGGARVRHGRS